MNAQSSFESSPEISPSNIDHHQSITADVTIKEESVDEPPSSDVIYDHAAISAAIVVEKEEIDDNDHDVDGQVDFDNHDVQESAGAGSNKICTATLLALMDDSAVLSGLTFDEFDFDQIHMNGHSGVELRAHYEHLRDEAFRNIRLKDEVGIVRAFCREMNIITTMNVNGESPAAIANVGGQWPQPAYIRFCLDFRAVALRIQPRISSNEILTMAEKAWHELSTEKRQPYVDAYSREWDEYKRKYSNVVARVLNPSTSRELPVEEHRGGIVLDEAYTRGNTTMMHTGFSSESPPGTSSTNIDHHWNLVSEFVNEKTMNVSSPAARTSRDNPLSAIGIEMDEIYGDHNDDEPSQDDHGGPSNFAVDSTSSSQIRDETLLATPRSSNPEEFDQIPTTSVLKRPRTSYLRFYLEFRAKTAQARPDLSVKDIMIMAGEAWRELSADQRQPYVDARSREWQEYKLKCSNTNDRQHHRREIVSPKKATTSIVKVVRKRPKNPFLRFCSEFRAKALMAQPAVCPNELWIMAGKAWNEMSAETRQPYVDEYNREWRKYDDDNNRTRVLECISAKMGDDNNLESETQQTSRKRPSSTKTAFDLFAEAKRKKYLEYLQNGKMEKQFREIFEKLSKEKRDEWDQRARLWKSKEGGDS